MRRRGIKSYPEGLAKVARDVAPHGPDSGFLKIVESARPTRRRIPVASVAKIMAAFERMRA